MNESISGKCYHDSYFKTKIGKVNEEQSNASILKQLKGLIPKKTQISRSIASVLNKLRMVIKMAAAVVLQYKEPIIF